MATQTLPAKRHLGPDPGTGRPRGQELVAGGAYLCLGLVLLWRRDTQAWRVTNCV